MHELQATEELDQWYGKEDPWGYEINPEDQRRKLALLSELSSAQYRAVLDIGCGHGFVTRDLPGESIIGVDVSSRAIERARLDATDRLTFLRCDLFDLDRYLSKHQFDLIVMTGILYPQYVGRAHNLVYRIVDQLLSESGVLVSIHIDAWYEARFPYAMVKEYCYPYREHHHRVEVYRK